MTIWNRQTPLGGPLNPLALVTERDFASHILSRHAQVESVDIRDCDPGFGHCTIVLTGGDAAAVLADCQPLTLVDLHIREDRAMANVTPEAIVRALAASRPFVEDDWERCVKSCTVCGRKLYEVPLSVDAGLAEVWVALESSANHPPDCPWTLAVEWVAENPG